MYAKSTKPSAKREVQKEWSAKRDDQIARPRRARTCERSFSMNTNMENEICTNKYYLRLRIIVKIRIKEIKQKKVEIFLMR